MFWHPDTQKTYTSKAAQITFGILGLSRDNCEDFGFVVPDVKPQPKVGGNQRAVRNAMPTLTNGLWSYGWTLETVERAEMVRNVDRERRRRLEAGSAFTVAGVANPIPLQGRPFDQTVYLALLTRASGYKAAGVTDPVLRIRDAADGIHMLTPDQMISLISQSMTWFESVMTTSWAMKDGTGDFTSGIPSDFTDDKWW